MQFQQDCPKDKKVTALKFVWGNLEKIRSTELCGAAIEGWTIFFLSQLFGQYVNGKLSIS